jgi:predicted Zn-ribbon and HTH transcriptional regulator
MRKKTKEPVIPARRMVTVRQDIISALAGRSISARDISASVRVSEKEVYGHLEHIKKSKELNLKITPAVCRKCGFVFRKRERLKRPGRCPVCKGESMQEPLFCVIRR